MCSLFGLGAGASLAVLVAGSMALGLSLPAMFKAGVAWFKHKLNMDKPAA